MKTIKLLTATIASGLLYMLPGHAQTIESLGVETLRTDVQRAVCLQDWNTALVNLSRIIGSSEISANYRDALMRYRRQIQTWRDLNTVINMAEVVECQPYLVVEESPVPETFEPEPSRFDWDSAISSTQFGSGSDPGRSRQTSRNTSNCDPSYPSICIPVGVSDLDCRDLAHRNFIVQGSDPHRFDGDGDGIGCER